MAYKDYDVVHLETKSSVSSTTNIRFVINNTGNATVGSKVEAVVVTGLNGTSEIFRR